MNDEERRKILELIRDIDRFHGSEFKERKQNSIDVESGVIYRWLQEMRQAS